MDWRGAVYSIEPPSVREGDATWIDRSVAEYASVDGRAGLEDSADWSTAKDADRIAAAFNPGNSPRAEDSGSPTGTRYTDKAVADAFYSYPFVCDRASHTCSGGRDAFYSHPFVYGRASHTCSCGRDAFYSHSFRHG